MTNERKFEILITDLKPEVQKELEEFLGDNGNWDIFPMLTLYKYDGHPDELGYNEHLYFDDSNKAPIKDDSFDSFLAYGEKEKPIPSDGDFDFGSYAASVTTDIVKKN